MNRKKPINLDFDFDKKMELISLESLIYSPDLSINLRLELSELLWENLSYTLYGRIGKILLIQLEKELKQ